MQAVVLIVMNHLTEESTCIVWALQHAQVCVTQDTRSQLSEHHNKQLRQLSRTGRAVQILT